MLLENYRINIRTQINKMRFLFLLLIPETGEGRKKEKEENMDVRNIDQLPLAHTSTGD